MAPEKTLRKWSLVPARTVGLVSRTSPALRKHKMNTELMATNTAAASRSPQAM